ncbi:MAG: leucine-rich repeat protein [Treponema sp.]|jgi:hypothetical protein|nr:leucine-rich repeat protein [Treponema sp.]
MKTTMWSRSLRGFGIAALFAALVLAGCTNPLAPPNLGGGANGEDTYSVIFGAGNGGAGNGEASGPAQSALGQIEPYTVTVYLSGDGEELSTEEELSAFARSVAGPTEERIQEDNIRNYAQVIAIDIADKTIVSLDESRKVNASRPMAGLRITGLVRNHTYGILHLEGRWERDYAAETGGNYVYTDNPPTLLSAGYHLVTYVANTTESIVVYPIYVDTVFTAAGMRSEPAVNAGKPGAADLLPAEWTANWKILRKNSAGGLDDLITAQSAAGSSGYKLLPRTIKAVVRANGEEYWGETQDIVIPTVANRAAAAGPAAAAAPAAAGPTGTTSGFMPLLNPPPVCYIYPVFRDNDSYDNDSYDNDYDDDDDGWVDYVPAPELLGYTVTLPLAPEFTNLAQAGQEGSANFELYFTPFNLIKEEDWAKWAAHDASSEFDLESGPPEWVIRNGLNDQTQDDATDFANFGKAPVEEANGNGAVRFTVVEPNAAAAKELVASGGYYEDQAITFTASGFTGTAQAWYTVVPAKEPPPAYTEYSLLGNIAPGKNTEPVSLPKPNSPAYNGPDAKKYDAYVILFKDGKAGKPYLIMLAGGAVIDPTDPTDPNGPPPGPFDSVAAAQAYLTALAAAEDPRGTSIAQPVKLPMVMNLSGVNSLPNLLSLIAEQGKYVDLDLSACTLAGTAAASNPGPASPSASNAGPASPSASNAGPASAPFMMDLDIPAPASDPDDPRRPVSPGGRAPTIPGGEREEGLAIIPADADGDAPPANPANGGGVPPTSPVTGIIFDPNPASNTGKNLVVSLVLPDTAQSIKGCTETAADYSTNQAFRHFTNLKTVSGAGITTIGGAAFYKTSPALTTANFPNVITIQHRAFERTGLVKAEFPKAESVGLAAFYQCASLTTANLPAAYGIGGGAFYACTALATVNLPKAETIGETAFKNSTALTAVNLPLATGIGDNAFERCTAMTSVNLPRVTTLGQYALRDCTALKDAKLPAAAIIPIGVFLNAASLTTVNLSMAQDIGGNAFQNCTSLKTLALPAAKKIGDYAFQNCGLTTADFNAITDVGQHAFYQCAALTTLRLEKAAKVGNHAFRNCTALTTLTLPAVTSLGESAFLETGTKDLTITMPRIAPAYSPGSQVSAKYAKTVTLTRPDKNIRNSTTYDELWRDSFEKSFGGSADITLKSNQEFFTLPLTSADIAGRYLFADDRGGSMDNPVPLPMQMYLAGGADELQKLFSTMFPIWKYVDLDLSRCTSNNNVFSTNAKEGTAKDLVVSLTLPNTAWGIRDDSPADPYDYPVFNHFNNLKSVSGAGITYIGMNAFMDRTTLETVNFPAAQRVGDSAFERCTSLKTVNLPRVEWLGSYVFRCSPGLPYPSPFTLNAPNLREIGNGGKGTFECSGLKEAYFPRVTELGHGVFFGCMSLTKVTMTAIRAIPQETFSHCAGLTEVNMQQVIDVASNSFWGCSSLKSISFPHVDNGGLGNYVFARCTSLDWVDLSFYEPVGDAPLGVFWESGSTPITIVLNPLEWGRGNSRNWRDAPSSGAYSKQVTIRVFNQDRDGHTRYSDHTENWIQTWQTWFGSKASLGVSYDVYDD